MQLVERRDASVDIVRKALPQMSKLGIPITPANYAVWFEYMRSSNRALSKEMDSALQAGRVTTQVIEDLYRRYIEGDASDTELRHQLREGLRGIIASFRDKLSQASTDLGGYGAALSSFSSRLGDELPPDELLRSVGELADLTRAIAEQSAALQRNLDTTANDVTRLEGQLDSGEHGNDDGAGSGSGGRAGINAQFEQQVRHALERDTHGPCLLLLAIDDLAELIASHGAEFATQVATGVTNVLKARLRADDLMTYFEENVLAIVLTDLPASGAPDVAEGMRAAVAAHEFGQGDAAVRVTLSIGLAWMRQDESMDELVERADAVLFLSQEGGQDRVTIDR